MQQDIESLLGMTLIRLQTKVAKLIIIHFEDKEFSGGQGEQSLIGRSEAQNLFIRVQPGHLLFGNLGYLSALLPVEEDSFQRRWLPVDERQADAVAQRCVGEVRSAAGKLLPLGRLDKPCKEVTFSSLCHPLLKKKEHNHHENCLNLCFLTPPYRLLATYKPTSRALNSELTQQILQRPSSLFSVGDAESFSDRQP